MRFLDLLSLPRPALVNIFAHLDFSDALSLSLAHSMLLDVGKQNALRRFYGCVQCFTPLREAGEVNAWKNSGGGHVTVNLGDGIGRCLGTREDFSTGALAQGIYFGEEQNYTAFPLRPQMLEEFRVSQAREDFIRVHEIFCRCGLFLGVHIVQLHGYRRFKSKRKNINRIENWRYQMYIDRVFIVERYMTLIRGREVYIPLLDLPPNVIVLENLLGRLEDGYLSIMPRMKIVYICKGILRTEHHGTRLCENVIFEHRSILSDQHFWQLPRDGNVQDIQNAENDGASNTYRMQHEERMDRSSDDNNGNAYYVNHVESPLQTVQQRNLDLLQGNMTIADIACNRCGQLIGWRFIKSLENDRNHEYEGRWGFVISSVRKEMKHHMRTYFECPIEFISRP